MELTIHYENYQRQGIGEIVMLKPCGPIDQKSVQLFESKVLEYYRKGICRLILDLCETKYLNSTGLGLLINIAHRVNVVGGGVRLVNVAEKFRVLFDMLGLESCLPIFSDVESALKSFEIENSQTQENIEKKNLIAQPPSKIKVEDIKIEEPESNYLYKEKPSYKEILQQEPEEQEEKHQQTTQNFPYAQKENTEKEPSEEVRQDLTFDSFFLNHENEEDIPDSEEKESMASPQIPVEDIKSEEEDENSFRSFLESEMFQENPIKNDTTKEAPQVLQTPDANPQDEVEITEDIPKTISRFVPSRPMTKKPLLKKTLGMMKEDLKKKNNILKEQESVPQEEKDIWEEKKEIQEEIIESPAQTKVRSEPIPLEKMQEIAREIKIQEQESQNITPHIEPKKSLVLLEQVLEKEISSISEEPKKEIKHPEEQAKEKPEKSITIMRKVSVWYYSKMKKSKTYPFVVVLTGLACADKKKNSNLLLIPNFPGCQVVPEKLSLNAVHEKSMAKFWITPHTSGSMEKDIPAWIDILHQGKSLIKWKTPFVIVNSFVFYITVLLALIAPALSYFMSILWPDILKSCTICQDILQNLGGWKSFGLICSGLFFVLAFFFFIKTLEKKQIKTDEKEYPIVI